jgi:hypothetical protein
LGLSLWKEDDYPTQAFSAPALPSGGIKRDFMLIELPLLTLRFSIRSVSIYRLEAPPAKPAGLFRGAAPIPAP